jgi:GAF domain-containing protein
VRRIQRERVSLNASANLTLRPDAGTEHTAPDTAATRRTTAAAVATTATPDDGPNGEARLQALHRLHILGTPGEPSFDSLLRIAATHYQTPAAMIAFVTEDGLWVKASAGVDRETGSGLPFCVCTTQSPEPLVIPDVLADVRFARHPLVTGADR